MGYTRKITSEKYIKNIKLEVLRKSRRYTVGNKNTWVWDYREESDLER